MSNNVVHVVIPNKKPKKTNVDDGLIEYTDALKAIDENSSLAKLNAISMSDNNGGRIYF
ncbi:hypothetical protein HY004_01450 [Candidatus Saccharibacteria bacterium]|nr:hypothetical protein [Candidatus Saccharibacteria bacterium]